MPRHCSICGHLAQLIDRQRDLSAYLLAPDCKLPIALSWHERPYLIGRGQTQESLTRRC